MLKLSKNAIGMLIAKYRTVLLHMLRKEGVALAVTGLLLTAPAPALAADYAVGPGQAYASLEALRTAGLIFADGDTVTLHAGDSSLTAPLNFGGAVVTLQGSGAIHPFANDIRLFTVSGGSVTLAPGISVEDFVNTAAGIDGRGGALYIRDSAAATANQATFTGNTAQWGGALYLENNSSLTADNAVFSNNTAGTSGGAAYFSGSNSTANGARFTDNMARWGGALYLGNNSMLTANNAVFAGNQANEVDNSGGYGGAVNLNTSALVAHDAFFTNNSADIGGGAVNLYNSSFIAAGVDFSGNMAILGGAAYLNGSTFSADNASFSGNRATQGGGALYLYNAEFTASNAAFTNNQAAYGGAAFVGDNGIFSVSNASFTGNSASVFGGAIYFSADAADATVNISTDAGKTTLFAGNTQQLGVAAASANSIFFKGIDNYTARLNIDGGGILDMRDPLDSYDYDSYNIVITKTGTGVWKLGGANELNGGGGPTGTGDTGSTTFAVNAGTLDLYPGADITITSTGPGSGNFTLAGGATLISRGGNSISAPTITLSSDSILGFDLTNATAGGTSNLTINGGTLSVNPGNLNIDILALNGSGTSQTFNLVTATGIDVNNKTLSLRGEDFAATRATGSLGVNGSTLQLTTNVQNGVVQWNGGSGAWSATTGNWTGLDTSGDSGGADLTGATKFLHGDAVVFDNAAGGTITIQDTGVQIAARPDGAGGTNPGLIITSGDWIFSGGAIDGGNIRFSGNGGITFDSRSLTQRVTIDDDVTAGIGAQAGNTLTFSGLDTTAYGFSSGAIYVGFGAAVTLNGDGEMVFSNNRADYGAAINSDGAVDISGGTNSFTGNTASESGGAVWGDTVNLSGGTNSFTGNSAGNLGGAIYADENASLTADGGDITFRGNTHKQGGAAALPNALYLENYDDNKTLTLAAKAGRSIFFYDPVASNSSNPNLTIGINPDAADSGTILFDTYQSEVYGNTTVHNGALQLTGGAAYGASGNTGSFTLARGVRLGADAAGGTVNAGSITLATGSTTAVDLSSGNSLALNGAVTIDGNATLDITGYSQGIAAALHSNQAITGSFANLTAGGQTLAASPPSLSKFLNDATIYKTNGDKTISVLLGGLVWNNTATGSQAHGTFDIASSFTLAAALADNTATAAHAAFGWDGKTLTKTGSGSLTLAGANTYSGGTRLNTGTIGIGHSSALGSGALTMEDGATLSFAGDYSLANAVTVNGGATMNSGTGISGGLAGVIDGSGGLAKTGDGTLTLTGSNTYSGGTRIDGGTLTVNSLAALGSGAITNNATLAFFRSGATAGQTIDFGSRYAGGGTLGIQASLTVTAQWSDLLTFDSAPVTDSGVYFTFTAGSGITHMPEEGLHFAQLAAADGADGTFSLAGTSLAGASQLSIETTDNQNYYLTSSFNPSLGKVYSETAAAGLGQAAGLHGTETFAAIGQAAAGAAGGDTGVYAGGGRSDARHHTGSHADVQGNRFALALAWEKGDTAWGIIGQTFDGSYTTIHTASVGGAGQTIYSAGDLEQHDLGLFAEYRPDDSGRYWQALVKGGSSKNDFRADNAQGGSRFRSDRGVFGLSLGGGLVRPTAPSRNLETYQHLIFTRLGSDRVIDSIGQEIRFDSSDSLRMLAGARWTLEREGKPSLYAGAALDYEFRGKTGATIDGNQADGTDLQGLTGILELGFSARQSETLSLDGVLYGYVGKKEGLAGSLTLTKRF